MRLIDANEIKLEKGFFENINNVPKFFEWLGKQPTIDPVKHGHWVWKKPSDDCRCSNCGKIADQKYPYCPWCGARMKGEEDEAD